MAKKGLFTGTALKHLNLGRCPWNPCFSSALSRYLGKTFTYKAKDREIVLSCLVLSCFFYVFFSKPDLEIFNAFLLNGQMDSLHIEPVWGCDPNHQRLCCCQQSASVHCVQIASLRKGFRGRPRTVTRLQCWGSMAIPSRERTQKVLMPVWWLKEHHLHSFAAIACQF